MDTRSKEENDIHIGRLIGAEVTIGGMALIIAFNYVSTEVKEDRVSKGLVTETSVDDESNVEGIQDDGVSIVPRGLPSDFSTPYGGIVFD